MSNEKPTPDSVHHQIISARGETLYSFWAVDDEDAQRQTENWRWPETASIVRFIDRKVHPPKEIEGG